MREYLREVGRAHEMRGRGVEVQGTDAEVIARGDEAPAAIVPGDEGEVAQQMRGGSLAQRTKAARASAASDAAVSSTASTLRSSSRLSSLPSKTNQKF